LLGDDANLFATNDDVVAFADNGGDLLGGSGAPASFESQFPDINSVNQQVWQLVQ